MKANLPNWERILRFGAACLLILAGFGLEPQWLKLSAWVSAGGFATSALLGWCPGCAMLGRRPAQRDS
jgi:hypothetical protein